METDPDRWIAAVRHSHDALRALAGLARMRLAEHAIHSWDVAVALDPSAKVAPEAVGLLIDTIGQLTARAGQPDGNKRRVHVSAEDPQRHFTLETGVASRSSPPRPKSVTRTVRSCGSPPRLSSGWSAGVSIPPTHRPSRPGTSTSASSGRSSPASEARA